MSTYVSAKFVWDYDTERGDTRIEAIDINGLVWIVPGMDCDVGDWTQYLANGGQVEPYNGPELKEGS